MEAEHHDREENEHVQPLLATEPDRIGDYRLLSRLGKGAMGSVYLARSRGGRVVAIKVIRPDLAEDPEFRERFRREAQMARSVGGFWTAAVVGADPDAEQPWLATEYIPGPTLHRAVADFGPLPADTVRSLGSGLSEALGAIHRVDLVHRDLKPGNVLLGQDGPRVIDFGISRAMTGQALTATGMFLGTPGFFSPEQTLGGDIGPASDVFSLGAVLVFAATGSGPFGEESTAALLYRVAHAEADLSEVPGDLRPTLAACLAKDPATRPTTSELIDFLGEPRMQGEHWLPAPITAAINEHATRLQQTVEAAPPDTPPPSAARPSSGTLAYSSPSPDSDGGTPDGQHRPGAGPPAGHDQGTPPIPATPPSDPGRPAERPGKIRPAVPRNTAKQAVADRARVRKDNPGPVFTTGGRGGALFSAVLLGLFVFGTLMLLGTPRGDVAIPYFIGLGLLTASGALSLLKAITPGLRLKLNSDGLLVSRSGFTREIPWEHVYRAGIVGRGKKRSVVVWCTDDAPPLRSCMWHRVQKHQGGAAVFPLGATGGWWTRRQEAKRIHTALQQYGRGSFDRAML
ncbi:hypothetical protein GCM10027563_09420 [Parasphingorhabdus pacifica]